MDAAEAQKLLRASSDYPKLKVMEAFMYRFHPQWQKTKQIVHSGKIGELKSIQSFFSYYDDDPASIGNKVEYGGGGLMDIGCYNISLSRFLFDREPERVFGVLELDHRFNVDRHASAILDFGKGTSTFTCSTQLSEYQHVNILGTRGRVEIEAPFIAPPDKACKIWLQTESEVEEIIFDRCDQYSIQGDLFSLAILNNSPVPTPLEDSVANMKVIEVIKESAASGYWHKV
jgi:predicted dehydrogenase